MITIIQTMLSVMMSVLCFFTSPIFGNYAAKNEPLDKENVRLTFTAISDIHLTDSAIRGKMLEFGLRDMQEAKQPIDALVLVGDNTDHGYREQYELLEKTMAKYTPAREIYLAEGNHDTWTRDSGDDPYESARLLFTEYNEKITGHVSDKAYYTAEVNGYPFIFLASEADHTGAYISDEQLAFFETEMAKAAATGKPIFVFCHWPINQTHGLPDTWGFEKDYPPDEGGLGDQSDAVYNILKKYDNVFYITGHIHSGFTNDKNADLYKYNSVYSDGNLHYVNLPSYMYMTVRGRIANGTGYQFEVYDDELVIRARSFSAGVWYTLYDYTIPITAAQPD